ncbi:hypothetical protein [Acidiphilium acidophilum]|uniref:hypothetical protein n=1 Tax=Acidiphilium acidophilum TaxID=76588 RepID=UPI002E8E79F0|nr:hypothetical protein [Acidiphilium acidophilum]
MEDGHINTIGRHTEPSQAEIDRVGSAMEAVGVRGWLAIIDRSAYVAGQPKITMVMEMREPKVSFQEAVARFAAAKVSDSSNKG